MYLFHCVINGGGGGEGGGMGGEIRCHQLYCYVGNCKISQEEVNLLRLMNGYGRSKK